MKIILFIFTFLISIINWGQVHTEPAIFEGNKVKKAEELVQKLPENTQKVRSISLENLQKKYNSTDFNYISEKENFSFLEKILDWIQRFFDKIFNVTLTDIEQDFAKALYFILFIIILGFSIWLISKYKGRWFTERNNKNLIASLQEVEQNIHKVDFQKLIIEAENKNDTRQSIRLLYLWLLKSLTDKNIIQWHIEKTNADYVNEIENQQFKNIFSELSLWYNYIWYGEFSVQSSDYQSIKEKFLKQITKK